MSTLTDAFAPALSATLDPVVARVAARRDAWVRVGLPERVALLRRAIDGVLAVGDDWVRAACHAKGIDPRSTLAGEEWISGPMTTVRNLRLLMEALEAGGAPRPMALRARPDGQVVADVFPHNLRERLMYSHMTVEVWIEPGQPPTQGRIYRDKAAGVFPPGRTCLVLGAGNVSSIGPLDVVHKLFVEDEVVVLKMNPVNDYLAPLFERAFAGLVELEVLAVVKGGADVGQYLCAHPAIDSIHLTGSDRTHDAIVWGETVEEQERRKAAGQPRIDKHVTSELGCVTPVLVVPGLWSERGLEFQARNVASMVAHNASFNCNAAKALVLARGWSQRDAFLEKLHEVFARLPARRAYYPGAEDRYRAFREHYPNARALGPSGPHVVPWTVIPNVPANAGEFALTREAFCGVLAEVSLDVSTADDFLREAVTFVNEHVWGTLSCVVIADGATQRRSRAAFDTAIADLRYGGIGINVWAGANFALGVASWGAFPGNTLDRVGSGIGVVHNTMLFDHPQKSIVRGPFRLWPTPVWFADHRNLADLGRRATFFEADPTWLGLPAVAWAGMKG
jgi:acyl-CoA reductase-like NAD-dependent aldehyde dehydrogenase